MPAGRSIAAVSTALCALLPLVAAVPDANTVLYKFEKRALGSLHPNEPRRMIKRQTVNTAIGNYELLYLINATVGTPPQPISMQLDTGSSDIWFPASGSGTCQRYAEYCQGFSYDYTASSTFNLLSDYPDFQIAYVDGSQIAGSYFTDSLSLGDTTVTNLTMAAATTFDRLLGIMGVGFQSGESSNVGSEAFTYPNIINVLKDQGKIDSLSYSLWLDDLQSNTGSILFGGVDKDKYTGSLVALPIQKDTTTNNYTSFTVAWTGLTITGSGNDVNMSPSSAQPAILDSGTTLTYLPDEIANSIYNGVGVVSYENGQVNTVPCSLANDDLTFSYTFGGTNGVVVKVPLSELVLPLENQDGTTPVVNGKQICQFGIAAAGQDPILFGDTFLRSAYVVYDLENLQIGLAQTNFNADAGTGSVEAISSGIPDVTSTADAASVQNTFTGRPLRTAGVTNSGSLSGGSSTRSASFKLSPTAGSSSGSGSSSSGNGKNAAGRPSADRSALAILAVTVGAFFFGAMLI